MELRSLQIHLHDQVVGILHQYGFGPSTRTWFVAETTANAQRLTLAYRAARQEQFWADASKPDSPLAAEGGVLPPFFQNLLPEGALREHIIALRGCAPDDHFDLLAACGADLPGAVYAMPAKLSRAKLTAVVTQGNDALEPTVTAQPIAQAISLSGVQPKLSVILKGGRYVARTKAKSGLHYIAKLPTVQYPHLPEVEHLSLQLAKTCGVDVVETNLADLSQLDVEHQFPAGDTNQFLAVRRYDRDHPQAHRGRLHQEDFAQVLSIQPGQKYTGQNANYSAIGKLLQLLDPSGASLEDLWRRLVVNELLGNYDAHVKNFALLYPYGTETPRLAPAYDIVAYSAYLGGRGHAMRFTSNIAQQSTVSPATLREFCDEVGVLTPRLRATGAECVRIAVRQWPEMIEGAAIPANLRAKILQHFKSRPITARYFS